MIDGNWSWAKATTNWPRYRYICGKRPVHFSSFFGIEIELAGEPQQPILDLEQELPRCLAGLQVLVRLSDVLEGIHTVDADVDLARLDEIKQLFGILLPLLGRRNVPKHHRAQELDVLGSEAEDVDRVNRARLFHLLSATHPHSSIEQEVLTAFPNTINVPLRATTSRSKSNVALPTPSKITSTPLPPVISNTLALTSSVRLFTTHPAPSFLAFSHFSSVPAVPITRAPNALSICTSSDPVPPAAACTSVHGASPTPYPDAAIPAASRMNVSAVRPWRSAAAPCSVGTPSGRWTTLAAGTAVSSA